MEEPETENVKLSPYNRFKQKLDKKMDKMTDKLRKEVNEELQDNERHVNDAQVRYTSYEESCTVCPKSSDPILCSNLLYELGHYFLDIKCCITSKNSCLFYAVYVNYKIWTRLLEHSM